MKNLQLSSRASNALQVANLYPESKEDLRDMIKNGQISRRNRNVGDVVWKEMLSAADLSIGSPIATGSGISLRDYFAAAAMQGFVSSYPRGDAPSADLISGDSYTMADAMLAARKEGA